MVCQFGNKGVNPMPNIKSAIKRVKVSDTKNLRNRIIKSRMRTAIKKYELALNAEDVEQARALLITASSAVDRAASKGTIHPNAANRKKARMAKSLNKLASAK